MVKQRFTTFDVYAMSLELQCTLFPSASSPYRVQNVYQLSQKIFVLKLTRSEAISLDVNLHPLKIFLLLESGIRFHPTLYDISSRSISSASTLPPFLVKLRQYIKGKRITALEQLGDDRIIQLIFGSGEEYEFRLYLELYSSGNIIITNANDNILSLLRVVENDKLCIRANVPYKPHIARLDWSDMEFSLEKALASCHNPKKLVTLSPFFKGSAILAQEAILAYRNHRKDIASMIKDLLSYGALSFSGYIFKSNSGSFSEYSPIGSSILSDGPSTFDKYSSFGVAVDIFYATMEFEQAAERERHLKAVAEQKKITIRETLDMRISDLRSRESDALQRAQIVEENEELVGFALWAIQSALATGMSWEEVSALVKKEQEKGNSVALVIDALNFQRNSIKVILPSLSSPLSTLDVFLDLSLSARGNAQWWYNERRSIASKCEKAIEAQSKALASAFRKIDSDLKEALSKLPGSIDNVPIRKVVWFEKFSWFISSDGILVVAGANASQNELLVKRYMGPKDIYLHAELQGSPSVIIKCPLIGDGENVWNVPPATLLQAASMAICLSPAWTCNIVTSAYWVYSSQVSKTPPTGLYLAPGSFMVYGKKNFIAPSQLVYGFGFLFKLGDSDSIERHRQLNAINDVAKAQQVVDYSSNVTFDPMFLKNEESRIAQVSKAIQEQTAKKNESTSKLKKEQQEKAASKKGQPKPSDPKQPEAKPVPLHCVRGTRGKLKKIKEKYHGQDIEDVLVRLEILGIQEPEKHLQRRFSTKISDRFPDVIEDATGNTSISSGEKINMTCEKNSTANTEHQCSVFHEAEEILQTACKNVDDEGKEEEGEYSDDDSYPDELVSTSLIESFTGNPLPEDVISYSIAMCGPWSALQNFACSVKLTPGTLKKGKAVKMATSICLAQTAREQDKDLAKRMYTFIKKIKEESMINLMIQHCKVAGPSQVLQKIQRAQKKSLKQRAKEREFHSKQ